MDLYFMNDTDIGKELGHRVKTMRLNKNWTQQEISDFSAISLSAIKSIESGKGTIRSLIKILRALKSLDALNNFLPKPPISPKQLVKLRGKQRVRASKTKK